MHKEAGCWQVVQEYERAVIFRLGRLPAGGSKGPGREFLEDVIFLSGAETYQEVNS